MDELDLDNRKKPAASALLSSSQRLLVGRKEAAHLLSISARAVDYLVANKQLATRRIGSRVLIPVSDLQRFVRADHPHRLAG
jgi:excisionase family DNA binding protein